MNYKNYFNKALAELGTYKNAVKGVIAIHSADMREHEAKVAAMRGKYTESGNFVHAGNVTHAIKCFDIEKNDSYKNFIKVMDKANDILKESDKTSLTDDDKALINAILPDYDKYPSAAKSQAVEIAKSSSKMATLLMLDERYNETVSEALES